MTETTEARALRVVFDGLLAHREANLQHLIRKCGDEISYLIKIRDQAKLALTTNSKIVRAEDVVGVDITVNCLYTAIKEGEVTISNLEGLTRGALKFFDKPPVVKKASNVTKLPATTRNETPFSERGPTTARKDQRTDNPGRERQRKRKESPNNQ